MRSRSENPLLPDLAVASALVLLIVAGRLMTETPNFQPVMAAGLFAGFAMTRRWPGLLAVMGGMLLSDILLGIYQWQLTAVVYLALLSPLPAGVWLRRRRWAGVRLGAGVVGSAIGSAVLFYLTTNVAVWALAGWYPPTLAGLGTCLVQGLIFFKWTLLSNLLFASLLFGGNAVAQRLFADRLLSRQELAPAPVRRDGR